MLWFMAPLHTCWQIWKNRSTGQLPILPFLSLLVNCGIWTSYGACVSRAGLSWCQTSRAYPRTDTCTSLSCGSLKPRASIEMLSSPALHLFCTWCYLVDIRRKRVTNAWYLDVSARLRATPCFSPLAAIATVVKTKSTAAIPPSLTRFIRCLFSVDSVRIPGRARRKYMGPKCDWLASWLPADGMPFNIIDSASGLLEHRLQLRRCKLRRHTLYRLRIE